MQYVPNQSANAALAIVVNLMDALKDKGLLDNFDCQSILANSMTDLEANTVANNDARKTLNEIADTRFPLSP